MRNLIMKRPGEAPFVTWTKKRIINNLNFISLFQGPTGIGKTWSAISYAYQIDPDFSVDQIVFDFEEFMEVLNASWFRKKKWKIIIWDEPQITISNRNWQSAINKMMNYILSTFRHQNIILIFCAPYKDFLDSQSVRLLHCVFKCKGVNTQEKISRVRGLLQEYNPDMKKTYQHSLYVTAPKRKATKLKSWRIPIPPKHLIDPYEDKKTAFTTKLNSNVKDQIDEISGKKEKPVKRKALTEKQENVMKHKALGLLDNEIAEMTGYSKRLVAHCYASALNKGYKVEEFKEKTS